MPLCSDTRLPPDIAGLVICGRPREDRLAALSANVIMRRTVAAFAAAGGVVYGEGSGLAYLSSSMHANDEAYSMTGVLPLRVCLLESAARAYVTLNVQPGASELFAGGFQLRGTVDGTLEVWQEVAAQALGQVSRRQEKQVAYAFDAVIQGAEGAVEEGEDASDGNGGDQRLRGLAHSLRRSLKDSVEREAEVCGPVFEGYSLGSVTVTAAHVTFASNPAALAPFMHACRAVDIAAASAAAAAAGQQAAQRRLRLLPTTPPRNGNHAAASAQPFLSTFAQSPPNPTFSRSGSASSLPATTGVSDGPLPALSRLRVYGSTSSLHQLSSTAPAHRPGRRHVRGASWDERVAPSRPAIRNAVSRSQPHNAVQHSGDMAEVTLRHAASMSVCSTPPRRRSLSRTSLTQLRNPRGGAGVGAANGCNHRRSCVWPPRVNGFVRVTSCRDMEGLESSLSGSSDYVGVWLSISLLSCLHGPASRQVSMCAQTGICICFSLHVHPQARLRAAYTENTQVPRFGRALCICFTRHHIHSSQSA